MIPNTPEEAVQVAIEISERITFHHRLFNCMGLRFRPARENGRPLIIIIVEGVVPDRNAGPSYTHPKSFRNKLANARNVNEMRYRALQALHSEAPIVEVVFEAAIDGEILLQFAKSETQLTDFLIKWTRESILKALAHEVDEMLMFEGVQIHDPHRLGAANTS